LKGKIKKWGLCVKVASYCGIFGCVMGILCAGWMRLNSEEWVAELDKMLKDQSNSDVVTKSDWILASDLRSIALIGMIACAICTCAFVKGLKVAKADVEKMCEKQAPQEGQQQQRKKCGGGKKWWFKWMRPKVCKNMIPLILLAGVGVYYEKKIWNEIDPMSDKWTWSEYTNAAYWEAEEEHFDDDVKDWEDEVEDWGEDVEDWEDDVEDWVDEVGDDVEEDAEDIVFDFDTDLEERTMDETE